MIFCFSKWCLIDDYKRLYTPSNDIVNQPMQRDDTTGNTDQLGAQTSLFVQQTEVSWFRKLVFFGAVGSVDVWKLIETGEKLTFCADLVLSTSHGVMTSWNSTHQHEHDQICWMHLWYTFICWTHPQLAGGFTDGYGDCWVNMLSHSQYRVVQRWVYRYTPNPMTCFFLECLILRVSMTNIFFLHFAPEFDHNAWVFKDAAGGGCSWNPPVHQFLFFWGGGQGDHTELGPPTTFEIFWTVLMLCMWNDGRVGRLWFLRIFKIYF